MVMVADSQDSICYWDIIFIEACIVRCALFECILNFKPSSKAHYRLCIVLACVEQKQTRLYI